jgi:hypothetical protein
MALPVSNQILYICTNMTIVSRITSIVIYKESVSCLEYYIVCCIRIPVFYSSKFVTHICIIRRKKHVQRLLCVAEEKSPTVLSHGASSALN